MYLLNPVIVLYTASHSKFTFHYVSIKSVIEKSNTRFWLNLHSTMYLLNRFYPLRQYPAQHHLHSTMYLLNHI